MGFAGKNAFHCEVRDASFGGDNLEYLSFNYGLFCLLDSLPLGHLHCTAAPAHAKQALHQQPTQEQKSSKLVELNICAHQCLLGIFTWMGQGLVSRVLFYFRLR